MTVDNLRPGGSVEELAIVRATLDATPVPAALIDGDLNVLCANRALCELLGDPGLETGGVSYGELAAQHLPEASARQLTDAVRTARLNANPRSAAVVEVLGRRAHTFRIEVSCLDVPCGNRFVVSHVDLTPEHRQIERERDRLERAQAISRTGDIEVDLVTGEAWASSVFRSLFDLRPSDSLDAATLQERVHPEDRAKMAVFWEDPHRAARAGETTYRLVSHDGSIRHIRGRAEIRLSGRDGHEHVTAYAQDVTEAVEAVERLRTSEFRLREAEAIAHLGHWEWLIQSGDLDWSDEVYRIFGYEPGEVTPTYDFLVERIHPHDRRAVGHAVAEGLKTGVYQVQHRVVLPDGSTRFVQERGELTRDADGNPFRMLGVVHDISEMEQAHERLRRSEARLREAESIAHLGSWEWDVTNRTQEWSDEVYRIYGESADAGLTPDEMLARHVPPEEMERMNAMLRGILRGEHIEPLVHHVVRADGETRVVTMHARVTERDGDRIIRVIGASQDITEQAAREAEVKRATALLAQANAMALLAPYEWNPSEQTWWWSDQLYEVVGYTRDQLPPTGASVATFIHPDDRDQVIRSFMEASEARRGWDMEYRILRGDGEVRIVRDLAERITTEDGNALFRGSVQDITELTRLRERAMEAAAEVISIIDASLLPIIVIDEHGLVQRANAATERVFDWPVEELAGQDVSILAAGISLAEHGAYIDHYLRTGEASTREGLVIGRTREVRGRRRDGSEFPAQLTVAEAELGTGRRQFVGIVMDLTEQKATEEHLRQV